MAEATTTEITVTPKQLGKHLRSIRRKKGLSLSEVARGAGLSRRELVAYERGKLPVPESDLWVLAGSCGVDVSELMPTTSSMELTAAASTTSVGDTVSQLRRNQEDAGITPYLHTLHKLQALPAGKRIPVKDRDLEQMATALGATPRSIEQKLQEVLNVSPDEAERLRAMILVPPNGRGKPRALAASPSAMAAAAAAEAAAAAAAQAALPAPAPAPVPAPVEAPLSAVPTPTPFAAPAPTPFDTTTELPLPAPAIPYAAAAPAAPPAPAPAPSAAEPVQTFPVAPAAFLDTPLDAPIDAQYGNNVDVFAELARLPEPVPLGDPSAPMPDLLAPPAAFTEPLVGVPAIGPPEGAVELVDSTMPSSSGTTTATGAPAWGAADAPPIDVAMRQGSSTWDLGEPPLVAKSAPATPPGAWETGNWQPPAPEGAEATPGGFWEGTDDWAPPVAPPSDPASAGAPAAAPTQAFTDTTGSPFAEPVAAPRTEPAVDGPAAPMALGEDTWAGAAWDPQPWAASAAADTGVVGGVTGGSNGADDGTLDVNPWAGDEWVREPAEQGAWDHRPDPAATDSGFYVDWGTPETEKSPVWEHHTDAAAPPVPAVDEPAITAEPAASLEAAFATTPVEHEHDDPFAAFTPTAPVIETEPLTTPYESYVPADVSTDEPADVEVVAESVDAPPAWDTWSQPAEAFVPTPELVEEHTPVYETSYESTAAPTESVYESTDAVEAPVDHELAPAWDTWSPPEEALVVPAFEPADDDAVDAVTLDVTVTETSADSVVDEPIVDPEPVAALAPISWRADGPDADATVVADPEPALAPVEETPESPWTSEFATATGTTEPEPEPRSAAEEFVAAGPDWELGNALPLVEVRGQGGLVMRRADERWALADITTTSDFVAEVEVDFRSGPGLGVLFRASTDEEGRMSGYSFDIDPIYDGGGYLVRQWQSDRELWNPIARVSGDDPSSMYGVLLVRLELIGGRLSAQVNGLEVLSVDDLEQASSERGRDAATGNRVGVQAWSSTDLVIDTVRVAAR